MRKTKKKTYTMDEVRRLEFAFGYWIRWQETHIIFVPVDEQLAGPNGMSFTIINDDYPTGLLQLVENKIRADRDVIGPILVAEIEKCPNCGFKEEEVGFYLEGGDDPYNLICNGCNYAWKSDNWHDPKKYRKVYISKEAREIFLDRGYDDEEDMINILTAYCPIPQANVYDRIDWQEFMRAIHGVDFTLDEEVGLGFVKLKVIGLY